jgi:hypothetical protein
MNRALTDTHPSPWARRLGYAGLLPFVGGAAVVALVEPAMRPAPGYALLAYAATIVAFLGGVHWGAAMRAEGPLAATRALVWGVLPQLLAWGTLLLPLPVGLLTAAALLVLCYAVDRHLYLALGLRHWLALRLPLSIGAAASCAAAGLLMAPWG